jgi:Na+-driven multidrug efflux pump
LGLSISKIITANLGGIGKPQYASYTSIITLGTTIALDMILIPNYSIIGAAIASSVAYLVSAGLLIFWFSMETNIKMSRVIIPRKDDIALIIKRLVVLWNQQISEYLASKS